MRTIAWETVCEIALRNFSKEVTGKVSIYVILMNGEYKAIKHIFSLQKVSATHKEHVIMKDFSAFLDIRRYKN